MQQKNGEIDRFENALKAPKIIGATTEEIKQVLRFSMILVGLRANTMNLMSEEEKIILIEFLREKYSYHTVAEIKLAFTKAAAHELDIDEVNHYENFTCEYVGKIMSAYRKWARFKNGELNQRLRNKELEKYNQALPEKIYTKEEILENGYQNWRSTKNKHIEYINPACFDILIENNMITITEEKKINTINRAKTLIFLYDMPKNQKDSMMKDVDTLDQLCKKITVADYFNACHNDGVIQLNFPDNSKENDFT